MKYFYKCNRCDQYTEVTHGMTEDPVVMCEPCNQKMRRAIKNAPHVVWGGLPPHREDEIGPAARNLLDDYAHNERLERHLANKEKRDA